MGKPLDPKREATIAAYLIAGLSVHEATRKAGGTNRGAATRIRAELDAGTWSGMTPETQPETESAVSVNVARKGRRGGRAINGTALLFALIRNAAKRMASGEELETTADGRRTWKRPDKRSDGERSQFDRELDELAAAQRAADELLAALELGAQLAAMPAPRSGPRVRLVTCRRRRRVHLAGPRRRRPLVGLVVRRVALVARELVELGADVCPACRTGAHDRCYAGIVDCACFCPSEVAA